MLRLEAKRGYDNRAVTGGTARLLLEWLQPAAAQARSWLTRRRLSALCAALADYPDLSVKQRARVLQACALELQTLVAGSGPPALDGPLSRLPGIGPQRAYEFSTLGLFSIRDLLLTLPARYTDASAAKAIADLSDGEQAVLRVRVVREPRLFPGRRANRVEAPAKDDTGRIVLQWFNQPYRAEQLSVGDELIVLGRPRAVGGHLLFVVSRTLGHLRAQATGEQEVVDQAKAPGLLAEYRSPEGVPGKVVREAVAAALEACWDQIRPVAPPANAKAVTLLSRPESLRAVHRPTSLEEAELGRRSLVFEQLLVLQVRLLQQRAGVRAAHGTGAIPASGLVERMEQLAGFKLTAAQARVIGEIAEDLEDERPAYRLVHGDVGSGKTIVAASALLAAMQVGRQAALMAPTEILAEQQALRLAQLLGTAEEATRTTSLPVYLLTGSLAASAKEEVREAARSGEVAIYVGTHALIQETVEFRDLAVVVVDEQHRFGVTQRAALVAKGYQPNFIALSATPIPRTLALALYADFDISVLDELPPGRKPVETRLVAPERREEAYWLLRERLEAGQQGFVVCPLIEPSETLEAKAAEEQYEALRTGPLSGLRLGLVHGRLPTAQRQEVMQAFYEGALDVLVSTTVIEVGLDVPKASVILVESAERFGLAQIHQLRGRVARSRHQPLCMLIAGSASGLARERLRVVTTHTDGFRIAEADLRLRGAGELAGLRQHGIGDWVVGDVLAYPELLVEAQRQARDILNRDRYLASPEHAGLREEVEALAALEKGRWAL